ncbi:transcriptional regulator, AraC family [Paenibacillus curdlanolyticus YK9]|uniref:Transcriptional regulator, AraC family n=1 Tax=Paenibacillus curdlanolyticus YK9 TaxID=717606 RepID=E0IFG0_9BACL|nr:AraC family transcriptional regulator [Paenibacillus curdlanolyticus]EFM08936.1 transcriptional regulator, AraC family [Paenibacillus curdlanolyticus YK9]
MLAVNMEWIPRITLMGFVSYKSLWMHFKRTSDEHILYIIKSGELHIQEEGQRFILREGDVFMLEPHLEHEGFEMHICDYYFIHFKHPDISALTIEDPLSFAQAFFLEDHEHQQHNRSCFPKQMNLTSNSAKSQIYGGLNEMLRLYRRKNYNRALTALKLSELFIWMSREYMMLVLQSNQKRTTKSNLKVYELLDYIHQHYASKITSERIESEFDCNFDYINRTFNQLTGYSIAHYVNKVRIDHARELLQTTKLSIGEIAELVGFFDIYHFSKVFKRYVGVSPTTYFKGIQETVYGL